ncbi:phosphotransferase family protein [Gammaproteobacteria bacterium]|nr:phosphotransferase family protein [Gammaproteobacteria bacterium]MDB9700161.1 phosphotransferase family protein [Gammaproteobacteria bacterium]MDC0014596.1 phosphotransferase family protein [Gammaproteobacteria bacterium]MDC1326168.1 phosphotransferase family protein [Gammaproteobacteria bacterium]
MESNNHDIIFSGTKEVAENLKFNESKLQEWMRDRIPESGKILQVSQFKGGQSNPTYKIQTEKKSFVLRRKPPGDLLKSAHAVDREYKVMTALQDTEVPVPKTYGLCEDREVIGTEFFMMDFLDGKIYWDLMLADKSPAERRAIYLSKNKVIAELHKVDYQAVGLADYGKPGNYVARQVSRWTKQYLASQTEEIAAMNQLIDWLPNNIPNDDETCIVHGDYRLDNMVFNSNNKVMGVLDWELSTLGHPIADFNYHCISWRNIPQLADEKFCKEYGIPSEREYLAMYSETTGKDLSSNWEFYYIFNIFKLAGILQGIIGRVRDGTAASKHAEDRADQVKPLAEAAWSLVEKNYK